MDAQHTPKPANRVSQFRDLPTILSDAIRYWERRRILYNLILAVVVIAWIGLTWPHFRPAFAAPSLLLLVILAALANLCYCAAYVADVTMQFTDFGAAWRRGRWILWLLGMVLAVVLANYWIVDEIYPFV